MIYADLLQSKIIERFHRVCEYNELINLRDRYPDDALRAKKMKSIYTEEMSSKFRSEFFELKKAVSLFEIKTVRSTAFELAKNKIKKLDFLNSFYTKFFIHGGSYYWTGLVKAYLNLPMINLIR